MVIASESEMSVTVAYALKNTFSVRTTTVLSAPHVLFVGAKGLS
jgi:hypothetical protein